ncbi:MAG: Malto-oligosyltrehalose synthase [Verrucomicrobia bacterium]|nr:Malto-oligosyltrehalose synthase [Verrucomicrobiota bacterium]
MNLASLPRIPRATYRVQLTPMFGFAAAEAELDYWASLKISDLYLSPIFAATPGSTHGYDVSDYTTINEEFGGRAAFDRLCAAVAHRGMGLILDFVPNHMATLGGRNRWWNDVLRYGRRSRYADFFDIHWSKHAVDGHPRILLPILETHFGKVVEQGKIRLLEEAGRLEFTYGDARLPVNVEGYAFVLNRMPKAANVPGIPDFAALAAWPEASDDVVGFSRDAETCIRVLADRLAVDAAFAASWRETITAFNRAPFAELSTLLDIQHYRLARWKAGIHEINYRRFFAISSLVGIRVEDPAVFEATHAALGELLRHSAITGLRIDHVDGLREPARYLERLQALALRVRGSRVYLIVEKILNGGEALSPAWPVHGTTGYEFIPQLAGIFVDASGEAAFTAIYQTETADRMSFSATCVARKIQIMRELFPDVVGMLGWQLTDLVTEDPRWRDFSRHELTMALLLLIAYLPVYRTYRADDKGVSAADQAVIDEAAARAIEENPRTDPKPIEFLATLLRGDYPGPSATADYRDRIRSWVGTWQQYTGAIMAKSVEDTAFYTYVRFIALNEVGGDPGRFGSSVATFHAENIARLARAPHTMLTTSTHDTKFSEDVRARLYVLSEFSFEWAQWVKQWELASRPHLTRVKDAEAPDFLDRYRLFQVLIGVWPLEPAEVDDTFRARLREHLRKAVSEAKRHTSEVNPNEPYLAACDRFIEGVTAAREGRDFLDAFTPAACEIAEAGALVSLAQVIIKATCPGVPDFYQGCESWDFSLVDPDNRRPVDYPSLHNLRRDAGRRSASRLLDDWRSGGIKFFVTQTLLEFRRTSPRLFSHGDYRALEADGSAEILAFARRREEEGITVILPRRYRAGAGDSMAMRSTRVTLPESASGWRDLFTGRAFRSGEPLPLAELFEVLPFAVLKTPS